jgi:uncharacterized protein YecE (DUF72 family)
VAVRIGTSGWTYPSWRGHFFPKGLPRHAELTHLASLLPAVEVNGTFYSMTRPSACRRWRASVPRDFEFAIKGSRYITHMLKLASFETPLANFFASGILHLGAQLGPILWQLPPFLAFDRDRADAFLSALPRDMAAAERRARRHDARTTGRAVLTAPDGRDRALRHALEVRHASWLADQARALLRGHRVALVIADTAGRHPFALDETASFVYVRLHGSAELYRSRYTDGELREWARRIVRWDAAGKDVYVFFDNTDKRHAPHDALRLIAAVRRRKGRWRQSPAARSARPPANHTARRS